MEKTAKESVEGFTPGPWSVAPDDERVTHEAEIVGPLHRDMQDCQYIAVVCDGLRETRANAHLIAAAPTMYEALRAFVDLEDRGHFALLTSDVAEALEAARAALATATPSED